MAFSKGSSALVERSPVYYGWVVLGISTLGMAATLPGQTADVSLFIDAFIEDLGLSRSLVSWFYTVATVLSSLGLPLVGRLVDRYGPRRMAVAVIALFAASCAGMSQVSGIPDVDVLALYGGERVHGGLRDGTPLPPLLDPGGGGRGARPGRAVFRAARRSDGDLQRGHRMARRSVSAALSARGSAGPVRGNDGAVADGQYDRGGVGVRGRLWHLARDAAGPPRQRLRLLLRSGASRHHPRPGEHRLYWRHSDWFIGGTAIGPAVLAMGPDFMGGFAPILWVCTPIPLVLALAALLGWAAE